MKKIIGMFGVLGAISLLTASVAFGSSGTTNLRTVEVPEEVGKFAVLQVQDPSVTMDNYQAKWDALRVEAVTLNKTNVVGYLYPQFVD